MTDEERYEKTFATGDHCELSLVNVRGKVQITGWDRPEVNVVAVKHLGNYWGAQEAFQQTTVDMDQQGAAVSLRTRMGKSFNPFSWMGIGTTLPEVEYTVQVPSKSEVAVRIVGGLLQVGNIQGTVYARAVNGDIFLEQLAGNIIIHGVNGRVSGQQISGNLGVRTVNGNVAIHQSRLDSLTGKTVNGDIAVESPLAVGGSYAVKTVSGNCRWFVPADTRADIELGSTSGKVQCDLPCTLSESSRGHWRGSLNGGGAAVSMRSVSGNLIIGLAGPAEPPPPATEAEPEPAPAGESPEMAVLRAVERGEVSVEQALQQLEEFMG